MSAIHLFNPMECMAGGSEHRLIGLFEILGETHEVRIWSEGTPHPGFLGQVPIQRVSATNFPKDGTFVFVGTYFRLGGWARVAKPRRAIIVHNLDQPDRLRGFVAAFRSLGFPAPEIVYSSAGLAAKTPDLKGLVQNSPVDMDRFHPGNRPERAFTVGRMSRDVGEKHHPDDPELYRRLGETGIHCRIMGGTRLGIKVPNVELLPENAEDAADFLRSLDAFVYRTHPNWYETYGRVAIEAMATGLPLVVEPRHGYASFLVDGESAMFAQSTAEFHRALEYLRNNPEEGRRIGGNARATAEQLYGGSYRQRIRDFYTK